MAKKEYDWEKGVILDEHTRKKLQILRDYFRNYLTTRCKHPRMEVFKLTVVDGFCGGGRYICGTAGSPIVFLECLDDTIKEINLTRLSKGLKTIRIECHLVFNDYKKNVVEIVKRNVAPVLIKIENENKPLTITHNFFVDTFENTYANQKKNLLKCRNIFLNLDQCGYSHVSVHIIKDIMRSWKSSEVILTFMITSLLTYLSPRVSSNNVPLDITLQSNIDKILADESLLSKKEWLGEAELIIYQYLSSCAQFVSPFSINNPDGWRYWLMHFSNNSKAREVYNDVLHDNCESQAHYGRPGLNMLSYDPIEEKQLYLFNDNSREEAKKSLHMDIPEHISNLGNEVLASDFFDFAYSATPAHSDDIRKVIIENDDIEVVTPNKGKRRTFNTIKQDDLIKLKAQRSIFLGL